MDKLIICETYREKYAVRPMDWAGICNEKGQIQESLNHLALFSKKEDAEKFVEWKTAEEQKRLLKLPCAVGDTVWYISERTEKQGRKKVEVPFVDKGIVDSITLGCMMIPQINVCNGENIWITFDGVEDFGKTVFLTREEAKAALEEFKRG